MITVACVKTGTKYGLDYVLRLKKALDTHMHEPFRFVCITDKFSELAPQIGVDWVTVSPSLFGWWAKMKLFDPSWRTGRTLYFDLDTLIVGSLEPLCKFDGTFGICRNFSKQVSPSYKCNYGSCVMAFDEGYGDAIWEAFSLNTQRVINHCDAYGDQLAIELLSSEDDVTYLQDVVPPGFFLGYRDLKNHPEYKPDNCSLVIYAGGRNPNNYGPEWCKEAWV